MSRHQYDVSDGRHVSERWQETDAYLEDLFIAPPAGSPNDVDAGNAAAGLERALRSHDKEGIPAINVSPLQGAFLHNMIYPLALSKGAEFRVLEIGTLAGYSTIWLAKAVSEHGGKVTTLEYSEKHAEVAKRNIAAAGYADCVTVHTGDARMILPNLVEAGEKYDFIFIDADKPAYPDYWRYSLQLSKRGTLIVADNVIRQGKIADPDSQDENVLGVRKYLEFAAATRHVQSSALSTVSGKGWDGFAISVVKL